MIPNIAKSGKSFMGAGRYYFHDKPYTDENGDRVNPHTQARVALTEYRNLVADDWHGAMREMWATADDQTALQRATGLKPAAALAPVKTISLAWKAGETPSRDTMIEAADDYLLHMGWQDHQAVYVAHDDTEHKHIHIILSRVHPETGKTLDDFQDKTRSQPWALAYELQQGAVQSPKRLTRDYATSHRQPQPKIAHGIEKEGRASEAPYLAATAEEDKADRSDRDLLHAKHTREREAFFAAAKPEFRAARKEAHHDVRGIYREEWRAHFQAAKLLRAQARLLATWNADRAMDAARQGHFGEAWQKLAGADVPNGFDPVKLVEERIAADRKALADAQKEHRAERQDEACQDLYRERSHRFAALKQTQKAERAELKAMTAAAEEGRPVDLDRLNRLLHGDRPRPTDPTTLLRDLKTANQNRTPAAPPRTPGNDNRAPVTIRQAAGDPDAGFAEPAVLPPPERAPTRRESYTAGMLTLLEPTSPFQILTRNALALQRQAQEGESKKRGNLYHAALLTRTQSMDNVQMDLVRQMKARHDKPAPAAQGRFRDADDARGRTDTERDR